MSAWCVTELGEPQDVLRFTEVEKPERKENEVLIKVKAVSLNFFDILLCKGEYQDKPPLPFTFGTEISGIVVEASENGPFKEGQRVLAKPALPKGGLAEYVSVNEKRVFPIPDQMSWSEAAALFVSYHTSYYALFQRANLKEGEVLLVHAGAGGVGSAAIQLGKAKGAKVIATAGGSEKTQVCRELGADIVIDYSQENFVEVVKNITEGRGADVIYDPVGGKVFERSTKCISFDGRILTIGFASGKIPSIGVNHILVKNYSVVGVHWGYFHKLYEDKVIVEHQEIMELHNKGKISPLIYKEFQFEEVPKALNLIAGRKTWGKVVVRL